jgi:hypothetical protein
MAGKKKKLTSRSAKAGLQFPVGRVHRHLKLGRYSSTATSSSATTSTLYGFGG